MAFPKASNYGNLPNGNFSPVIYSQKVQLAFRKTSVIEDVTNTDYFGEISNMGDTVRIIKEPEITINDYARGTQVVAQDLEDTDFQLTVDQANYFMFKIDDIEAAHSHVNFMDLATDRAAYRLRDKFDSNIMAYMSGYDASGGTFSARNTVPGTKADSNAGADELLAAQKLTRSGFVSSGTGTHSISIDSTGSTSDTTSPLQIMNRMARILDQNNVDTEDRWFIADPVFYEQLQDENSKLINNDFAGGQDAGDILRNGRLVAGLIRGFRVYKSNNLPSLGTGPGTSASQGSASNFGVVIAGHQSAIASAQQLDKTESYRDPDSFSDVVRGLQMFGRKILRPEAIVTANYNVA